MPSHIKISNLYLLNRLLIALFLSVLFVIQDKFFKAKYGFADSPS